MANKSEDGKALDQEKKQQSGEAAGPENEEKKDGGQQAETSRQNAEASGKKEKDIKQETARNKAEGGNKSDDKKKDTTKGSKSKTKQKSKKTKEEKRIEELEAKVEEQQNKIEEQKDKFLRLYAEFENFRRRTSKEKTQLSKTAAENIILRLLPIMDDYERAQQSLEENQDLEKFKEGIELIADKFWKVMEQEGLEQIESNNQEFHTDEHEAITKMPAPSEDMKGKVIDTTEKGYKLNGKVIRFAKVVVGN